MRSMSKQGNTQLDWRRISAAVIAVSILFAALFTTIHVAGISYQSTAAVEMMATIGGSAGGDTDSQNPAALPGDCDMHCNQHAPAFSRFAVGCHVFATGSDRIVARDDRGLYSAPQWGILEPPRA